MSVLRRLAPLGLAVVLGGCAASGTTSSPSAAAPSFAIATAAPTTVATPVATPPPTATPSPPGPFKSLVYGYTVTSPDWTGTAASTAWDGTGALGNGDPVVDTLSGTTENAFAYGQPTTLKLDAYADASNKANAAVHPCAVKPESSTKTTVSGAPARVDTVHCPAVTGVFAMTAFVVRAGRAYVLGMLDQPQNEAAVRDSFASLLKAISFD